jgi:hypothetical protein
MLLSFLLCVESNPFRSGDGSPDAEAKSDSEKPTALPLRLPPALPLPEVDDAFHVTLLGVEGREDIVML